MEPKTAKEKTIVDFIVAVAGNRDIGVDFAKKLKPQVKAEEIRAYLQGLGFAGVSIEDCEQILRIVNKHGATRGDALH